MTKSELIEKLSEANGILTRKDSEQIISIVFDAMADDSWRVRKEAVDLFVASAPDDNSIMAIAEQLHNEDNAGLRNSAAEVLIRLETRAAPALMQLVRDADAGVRKFAIDVMGTIGSTLFLPDLLLSLKDPDENVAAAAAELAEEQVERHADHVIATLFCDISSHYSQGQDD